MVKTNSPKNVSLKILYIYQKGCYHLNFLSFSLRIGLVVKRYINRFPLLFRTRAMGIQ